VKRFLSALLMRALPALHPPAFMSDASESVRRAWAAVSASVTSYLPTELPTLPRLPNLPRLPSLSLPSLPSLSLPKFSLPQVPTISPPLGRFFSSLTTLMFAPGQIHGLAIYYQVATGSMICDADAGPRVEWVDGSAPRVASRPAPTFRAALSGASSGHACVAMSRFDNGVTRSVASAMTLLLPASAALPTLEFLELIALGPSIGPEREHWVDLAAQGMRVRGQRPPPQAAANLV
jgi:hypothetical protein